MINADGVKNDDLEASEFRSEIAIYFELESEIEPGTRLIEDLGFDSLRMIELVSFIEDTAGLDEGDASEEYPILETIQDCFDYLQELQIIDSPPDVVGEQ